MVVLWLTLMQDQDSGRDLIIAQTTRHLTHFLRQTHGVGRLDGVCVVGMAEIIPLPFQCPDLVMPISGVIPIQQGEEFTSTLSELEKKLLLGLKLFITEELGATKGDQWIVWMAYHEKAFMLHMWKPLTGEIKQINLTNSTLLPDFDESGVIKSLRVSSTKFQSFYILNENFPFMDDLCQLFETASLASPSKSLSSLTPLFILSHLSWAMIELAAPPPKLTPTEFIKTTSKEDLLRDSSLTSRDSDSSVALSPEDIEKQRKRKAIGSVSMRRLSLTGRTMKKSSSSGEGPSTSPREQETSSQVDDLPPPPAEKPEMCKKKSVMSSVFGSITEDDSDGAKD